MDNRNLYKKFNVTRTDGQSGLGGKHHDCTYFTVDFMHEDPEILLPTLQAYVKACRDKGVRLMLADDLEMKCRELEYIIARSNRCSNEKK